MNVTDQPKIRKVLILCTGNSCRSQMAEGLVNHDLAGMWQAFSAGTKPSGYVHPYAVAAMNELQIDISANKSEHVDQFEGEFFDAVITVCDRAAEDCPVWLDSRSVVQHIPFVDPAKAEGDDQAVLGVFRQVRDAIRADVIPFLLSL